MKNEPVTFEALPGVVSEVKVDIIQIKGDVGEIRKILEKFAPLSSTSDRWLNLDELCEYHPDKPTKATVYGWVSSGLIPVHKSQKRLRFLKSEIDIWLLEGKKLSLKEADNVAKTYLISKAKGGKS